MSKHHRIRAHRQQHQAALDRAQGQGKAAKAQAARPAQAAEDVLEPSAAAKPKRVQAGPFPFTLERMRVLPNAPLRVDLEALGVERLQELPGDELLSALEAALQRIYGPVQFSSQRRSGEEGPLRLNPGIPGVAAAEATFLALSPSVAHAGINLTGQSDSFASKGRLAPDLETRKLRPIEYADGGYLVIVLVREDGTLIPLNQGDPTWQENTKFFGSETNVPETDALNFKALPEQMVGLVGLVAFNVGKNFLTATTRPQPLSTVRLTETSVVRQLCDEPSRTVLLDDRAVRRFYQLEPEQAHAELFLFGRKQEREFSFTAGPRTQARVFYWGKWSGPEQGANVTFEVARQKDGVARTERGGGANGGVFAIDADPGETVTVRGDTLTAIQLYERPELEELPTSPLGTSPDTRAALHRLRQELHGPYRAENVRLGLLRQATRHLSVVHLAELTRQTPLLMTLSKHALAQPDAKANGWYGPTDVVHGLCAGKGHLSALPGWAPPSEPVDAELVAEILAQGDAALLAELAGVRPEAVDGREWPTPEEAMRVVALLEAAGQSPALAAHALAHPNAPPFLAEEVGKELAAVGRLLQAADANVHARTPGELLRRMLPAKAEELSALGLPVRVASGQAFAVVARPVEEERLVHASDARRLGDALSPRSPRAEVPDYFGALGGPRRGPELGKDPFVRWSFTPGALEGAAHVAVAEVPLLDVVVDPFAEGGPQLVTGVLNPECIRWVVEGAPAEACLALEPDRAALEAQGGRLLYDRQAATPEEVDRLAAAELPFADLHAALDPQGLVLSSLGARAREDVERGTEGLRLLSPNPLPVPAGAPLLQLFAAFARGAERVELPLAVTARGEVLFLEPAHAPPLRSELEGLRQGRPADRLELRLARNLLLDAVLGLSKPSVDAKGQVRPAAAAPTATLEGWRSIGHSLQDLRALPPYASLPEELLREALLELEREEPSRAWSADLQAAGAGDEERYANQRAFSLRWAKLRDDVGQEGSP